MLGVIGGEPPDRHVEVEQQRAPGVVADQALRPEERSNPRPARDRRDIVQAGAGIDDHVAGRELHRMLAVGVLDGELAAVVVLRRGDEERGRDVSADLQRGVEIAADGVVDMRAEGHTGVIAVEQRREDLLRQHSGYEQGIAAKRLDHHVPELARFGRGLRKLEIVFHLRRLMSGGDAAVDPGRLLHHRAAACDLLGGEHVGNVHHHGRRLRAGRPGIARLSQAIPEMLDVAGLTSAPDRSATPSGRMPARRWRRNIARNRARW
jgi:hypothetical protein